MSNPTSKPLTKYPPNRRSLSGDQKCTSWLQEAMQYGKKAKSALNEAKNLKGDLKVLNFEMIDKLTSLVSDMEKHFEQTGGGEKTNKIGKTVDFISDTVTINKEILENMGKNLERRFKELESKLIERIEEGVEIINTTTTMTKENQTEETCERIKQEVNKSTIHMENFVDGSFDAFTDRIDAQTELIVNQVEEKVKVLKASITPAQEDREIVGEIRKIKTAVEGLRKQDSASGASPAYADAVRQPKTPWEHKPTHSLIISSTDGKDTSGEVIEYVKGALDAKKSGIRVEKLRKIRDGKIVLSCSTRTELDKIEAKLKKSANITFEEAKNKSPLVILKNVLSYNTNEEVKAALHKQNDNLLGDLATDISQAEVMYRRKARNQHECHLVLKVTPALYQRLVSVGRVYIDLQRVRVEDQSPLVQCTKCLAYGHGRKLCTDTVDLCYYCGGPHRKAECEQFLAAQAPTCKNCVKAKANDTTHSVYSDQCPIRKKWDALARTAVAYC